MSRAIAAHNDAGGPKLHETIVHTGQHYDPDMSDQFFEHLGLAAPADHLGVGSGPHGMQTGRMMERLEPVLAHHCPDIVLVYGDTNSTLAAALVAAKLDIPIAHVEAGLRSRRRAMAEEINRMVTDRLSTLLFCPSEAAVINLVAEGITAGVSVVGDVMHDVLKWELGRLGGGRPPIGAVGESDYALVTVHRAENTDDPRRLGDILAALDHIAAGGLPVVFTVHPRTRSRLTSWRPAPGVHVLGPLPYEEMIAAEAAARVILTDSGGVQKEAYWLGVPCVTLRDETEWIETLATGWNVLAGADPNRIVALARRGRPTASHPELYGDGNAAPSIVDRLPLAGY